MNNNIQTAIRAFRRVWAPIAVQLDIASAADAQFDGGEWSDAASARTEERVHAEALARVAARFGLTAAELEYGVEVAFEKEYDRFFASLQLSAVPHECNEARHLYVGDCCAHGSRCPCHVHTPSQLFRDHSAHVFEYLQHEYARSVDDFVGPIPEQCPHGTHPADCPICNPGRWEEPETTI